ncbi:MAG: hypothetical protein ACI9MR_000961 [Myxococcota bacterium]|jgi:hypothetical protein
MKTLTHVTALAVVTLLIATSGLGCDDAATVDPAAQLSVVDQLAEPANVVVVAEAFSIGVGFVVIHEDNSGVPGASIGLAPLKSGINDGILVTLDRDATNNETLHAMLHIDANADDTYDADTDVPAVDTDGNIAVQSFVVTVAAYGSVTVADQTAEPANQVVIRSVMSIGSGHIVIHEDDGTGDSGLVVGHALLGTGANNDVLVTLTRDAVDGETLFAMLHVDLGEAGTYEFPGVDVPAKDAEGNVIIVGFEVTVPKDYGVVDVDNQTVDPINEVVVDSVVSVGPGFIVIHEEDAGSPGPVLGNTAVSNGSNSDVKVTLSRDLTNGETLYAMLHVDLGTVGTYEFPGTDVPAIDEADKAIAPSFDVTVVTEGFGAVTVEAQRAFPVDVVVVKSVISFGPGHIVIHADDGGVPGDVLGNAVVADGANDDVSLTLSRAAIDGETLYAMLHVDLGDVGTYEFPGIDVPATDVDGNVITPSFVVDVDYGAVTVVDQIADPANEVVAGLVTSVGPGHVVIHADDNGSPGAVMGNMAVSDGDNANVVVTLDRNIVDGETLFAMLHIDVGTVGAYEFPGVDGPARDINDDVIVPSFVASEVPPVVPSVTAAGATFPSTSTVVVIPAATSDGPGFLVVHEVGGGVIGHAALVSGDNTDISITLNRPAVNAETLNVMLHTDVGVVGTYEFPGADGPVSNDAGVISPPFTVAIAADLPAVRVVIGASGFNYRIISTEPASWSVGNMGDDSPQMTLMDGARYHFTNNATGGHPFAFLGTGDSSQLAQNAAGALEGDAAINWVSSGDTFSFTVAGAWTSTISSYWCEFHTDAMQNDVSVVAP